ncbi:MAG: NAD-dependent deacylase [Chloroflexota bacterium]|nr:NAD-dependent deacylase [Chloroflexota bacterium]
MNLDSLIQQAAAHIVGSTSIAALTGAGVSKESGVPTFRDALEGLWAQYDPTALATPDAFKADPKLVWDFYEFRRTLMRPARPNPGHYALADLERRLPRFTLITQNVDDLHEAAGSRNVIRLHGRIDANRCSANCQGDPTPVDVTGLAGTPPPCPHCGALVRPDVVWFNEYLPLAALDAAKIAAVEADVFLIVGTSGVVSPAADLPLYARQSGATLIEVNPEPSALTPYADLWLQGSSGEVLPRLVSMLVAHQESK